MPGSTHTKICGNQINPSTKTKYWYKINAIESGQKSMQKSGKS
jgi:hypothetical protein